MAVPSRIVTLTTDFGTVDTFVGEMKGAMLTIDGDLRVVDLTHEVPPHDIATGALLLDIGSRAFPAGTVHVAVVDPGVGTARRALAVETENAFWVGPDNGVLARALRGRRILRVHALDPPDVSHGTDATTFEGRDRFAPCAARIATGCDLARLGPPIADLHIPPPPTAPSPGGPAVEIEIVHVDRFGNLFLDLERSAVDAPSAIEIDTGAGVTIDRLVRTYADASDDRPFLLWNAAGLLELAVRERRASDILGLRRGDAVTARIASDPSAPSRP